MFDAPVIDEDLLARLPLPLAQVFRRSLYAKSPLEQHLGGLYLAELGLKVLACGALVNYAALERTDPQLHECLQNLARPTLGQWWEFARKLVPVLADVGVPGYDTLRTSLLGRARDDLPRAAGLDASLRDALTLGGEARATVRLSELVDRLVQWRNKTSGHGAMAALPEKLHRDMSKALFLALAEIYDRVDVLAGAKLVYVSEVNQSEGKWYVARWELAGAHPHPLPTQELSRAQAAAAPDSQRLYLCRGSGADEVMRPLYPLLIYEPETEEVLLLNSRRGRRQVEWLSYTTGRQQLEEASLQGQHLALLGTLLKMPVDTAQASAWAARSEAEEAPGQVDESSPAQRTLGEFELISELGRGGMGIVYRAWQPSLGRQVAVKKLQRSGDKSEQRFSREIRALGRVEHPNLIKVYTSASVGDDYFYAMELVEGAPLSSVCERLQATKTTAAELDLSTWHDAIGSACSHARQLERSLSVPSRDEEAAGTRPGRAGPGVEVQPSPHHLRGGQGYVANVVELVRQAALAAHALHEAGIVHRDIKPGNIMVSADGSQAVLMDLGLAQLADEQEGALTRTRQFVGTLRYASPQQVLAAERVDCRSDVYSLGATLWELLSLEPLFEATDATPTPTVMERILHEDPVPLSRYNPKLPRDLQAIVGRCLEKRPERRYPTAEALAIDLGRFLRGEPVDARPVSRAERALRWVGRHRAQSVAGGLSILTLLLALIVVLVWRHNEHERLAAEARQRAAVQKQLELENSLAIERAPPPGLDEGPPDAAEVFPDIEGYVQDKEILKTKPPGWHPPDEVDFRCVNKTAETGAQLMMCNLTNHYQLDTSQNDDPLAALTAGEWRVVKLANDEDPLSIALHTGYGWYVLFVRTPKGDIRPLYTRSENGDEIPLGEINLFTSKHVVLTIMTDSFGKGKRYYASVARQD